jgi:hypothetical protein
MNTKIDQLLNSIINKNHSESKELFDSLVRERIKDRIEEKKVSVASKMMESRTEERDS